MSDELPPAVLNALVDRFRHGRVVPFLGAGASSYAGGETAEAPPLGEKLLELMAKELGIFNAKAFCGDRDARPGAAGVASCGRPLVDLARVASVYQSKLTRTDLNNFLGKVFKPKYHPNHLHALLAEIARVKPMLIVTTNYDTMVEDAFDAAAANGGRVPYDVVATSIDQLVEANFDDTPTVGSAAAGVVWHRRGGPASAPFERVSPSTVTCDLNERSMIYKIHGSVRRKTGDEGPDGDFVIAEEDYVRFLGRMGDDVVPYAIRTQLIQRARSIAGSSSESASAAGKDGGRTLLFLGYGLQDWNMRVLLDHLNVGSGHSALEKHYLVDRSLNHLQKMILEKKGTFTVVEMNLDIFVKALADHWHDAIKLVTADE